MDWIYFYGLNYWDCIGVSWLYCTEFMGIVLTENGVLLKYFGFRVYNNVKTISLSISFGRIKQNGIAPDSISFA